MQKHKLLQEVVALRRRLARLQKDMNKQTSVLEAAEHNSSVLQSMVCELTAETERLESVRRWLQDRLAFAEDMVQVCADGHHACHVERVAIT